MSCQAGGNGEFLSVAMTDGLFLGDPWQLPQNLPRPCETGDCESDTFAPEEAEFEFGDLGFFAGRMVPHLACLSVCQRMLGYYDVCEAFAEHMDVVVKAINGQAADAYPYETAMRIVGYFLRTWEGCPNMVCAGGMDYSELMF